LQPLRRAEARLERHGKLAAGQAELFRKEPRGIAALLLVGIAPVHRALRQAMEAHDQSLSPAVLSPMLRDAGCECIDVGRVIVEIAHHGNILVQHVENASRCAVGVLRIQRHDDRLLHLFQSGFYSGLAIAHGVFHRHVLQEFPKQRSLPRSVKGERRTFVRPHQPVFLDRLRRTGAQHDAVEDRKPDEARQLDDARIGKEFGEIAAHGVRRRRRRRAEVD
jgi:hypothetical protein